MRHLLLVHVVGGGDELLVLDHLAQGLARRREHEVSERKHAHEFVHAVHDVGVVRDFRLFGGVADELDGLVGGEILVHHRDLGVHDAARSLGIEGHERFDFLGFLDFHSLQQKLLVGAVEVVEHVGGVVGRHLLQNIRREVGRQRAHQSGAVALLHLRDEFGGIVRVEAPESLDLVRYRKVLQHIRTVRGVSVFELGGHRLVNVLSLGKGLLDFLRILGDIVLVWHSDLGVSQMLAEVKGGPRRLDAAQPLPYSRRPTPGGPLRPFPYDSALEIS